MRLLLPVDRFSPHDRAVALTMWGVGVVQGFGQAHPSVSLPFTRAGLGLTPAEMSAVLAVARLASLGALIFAFVGDRRGRRRPLLAAYVLILAGNGLAAASSSPAGFTISQSLVRIATSAISALGVVWLAEHLSPRVRAYGISIYGAAGSFGAALALLGLPLAERDWRLPYLLTLLGLLLLPVLARRLGESPLLPAASPRTMRGDLANVGTEMTGAQFWVAALAGLLASAFSAVGLAFSTERLVEGLGLSTGTAVMITLAGGTLGGVGFFLGGRMADAWGRRPTTVLSLSMILAGGLTLYHAEAVPLLVGAIVVSSFGSFAYIPSAATHRAELFPTTVRASMASALAWLGTVGSALGLGVGRLTIDTMGLAGTMTLLGSGMVAAVALTLALPETRARHLDAGTAPPVEKNQPSPPDQGGGGPPHPG